MSNPFAKFGISDSELAKHIRASAESDAAVNEFMSEQVIPYGRSVSPVDHGSYAASWKVIKKAKNGRGVVGPTDWKAHFIEDGTKADPSTSKSRFGPDTPTPEFAPVAKTVAHFGGTMERGISGEADR